MPPDSADLTCKLIHFDLRNPVVLASGVMGISPNLLKRAADAGAGAVTSKSCGPKPRAGHASPIVLDWGAGVINAVGLPNPGVNREVKNLIETKQLLAESETPLIGSFFAGTEEEFGQVASIIAEAEPDMLEVDISCPNVGDEFGLPFAASTQTAAGVTRTIKKAVPHIPLSIKLGPNVPNIALIARAVVDAGADCITAINTMPGMIIDADSGKPVLTNKVGGISGPALKPIALKCVFDIAQAVSVPIIGLGGILSGRDAAEMLMAGATAIGVGTAVWYRGVAAFGIIVNELTEFMLSHGYADLASMRGLALK